MRPRRLQHLAKQLFKLSIDESGRVDWGSVEKIVGYVKKMPQRQSRDLQLRYYTSLLHLEQMHEAHIEFAGTLQETFREKIAQFLKTRYHFPVNLQWKPNPDLLAGYRISIADDRWELSINQQLNDLKSVFQS